MDRYYTIRKKYWNRNCAWFPHIGSSNDLAEYEKFIKLYGTNRRQVQRMNELSKLFLDLNQASSLEDCFKILLGQWLLAGLAPGTIDTYWRIATRGYEKLISVIEGTAAIHRYHAVADTKHAKDFSPLELHRILNSIRELFPVQAAMLEIIMKTGLRCNDIRWLRADRIKFGKLRVHITVCVTKNRSVRGDKVTIAVPLWFGQISKRTEAMFKQADKNFYPFMYCKASWLNQALKKSCEPSATTYSFRRCFIRFALAAADFDPAVAAKSYTLHKRPETILAHYVPHLDSRKTTR